MAFDPNNLPMKVREAWQQGPSGWKLVVQRCLDVGINDPNRLADFIFYLNHPERDGKKIEAGDQKSIEEWKYFRAAVKDYIGMRSLPEGPHTPTTPAVNWVGSDAEWEEIRRAWGDEILAWAKVAPHGKEAKEFTPPDWLRSDYETVFFWKSADPASDCIASRRKRLQGLAMLRGDVQYWEQRWSASGIGAIVLRTAAETAIKDYRKLIVTEKLCPESAKLRLQAISKDVIYQMFLGMFQLLSPQALKGGTAAQGVVAEIVNQILSRALKKS
ncbi:MAG: hypothetical protein H7Y20_18320 [Bryobacteraceae bacterium]|nr:hypothetical protein [Bryobacteraceae bacterium]